MSAILEGRDAALDNRGNDAREAGIGNRYSGLSGRGGCRGNRFDCGAPVPGGACWGDGEILIESRMGNARLGESGRKRALKIYDERRVVAMQIDRIHQEMLGLESR